MRSYEIIVTPDAEEDLFEIRDYIADTLMAPEAALHCIEAIRRAMEKSVIHGPERSSRFA